MEDSPAGSLAARRAGMYVLALTSSQPKNKMTSADEWLDNPQAGIQRLISIVNTSKQQA